MHALKKMNCIRKLYCSETLIFRVAQMIYKIFGLCPMLITISRDSQNKFNVNCNYSKIGLLYNIGLLINIFYVIWNIKITSIANIEISAFSLKILLKMIELLAVVNVLWAFTFRQKAVVSIFNCILNIEKVLKTQIFHYRSRLYQPILIFFGLFIPTLIHSVIVILTREKFDINIIHYTIIPFVLSSSIIQYSMLLSYIKIKIDFINKSLSILMNPSSKLLEGKSMSISKLASTDNALILKKIIFLQTTYWNLHKILEDSSKFFSAILLPTIPFLCLCIVYNCYSLIRKVIILNNVTEVLPIGHFFWITISTFPVASLSINVTQTNANFKKTSSIIYDGLREYSSQVKIKSQLQQFSISLLHQSTDGFTVYQLFSIDNSLLTSLVGTVITYMVLLSLLDDEKF